MISHECTTCGKKMTFPADRNGEKAKCSVCGDPFIIGAVSDDDDDEIFGLAGNPKPRQRKPAKTGNLAEEVVNVPEGKVECENCHEFVAQELEQCPYCSHLISTDGPRNKKKGR